MDSLRTYSDQIRVNVRMSLNVILQLNVHQPTYTQTPRCSIFPKRSEDPSLVAEQLMSPSTSVRTPDGTLMDPWWNPGHIFSVLSVWSRWLLADFVGWTHQRSVTGKWTESEGSFTVKLLPSGAWTHDRPRRKTTLTQIQELHVIRPSWKNQL